MGLTQLNRTSNSPSRVEQHFVGVGSVEPELKIFALWRYPLEDARRLARSFLRAHASTRVVFARLATEKRIGGGELQRLKREGITVVPVARRLQRVGDEDPELKRAVLDRLQEEARLVALAIGTVPPPVDAAAAHAIDEAYKQFPEVTPAQRREMLDEMYGANETDDGER